MSSKDRTFTPLDPFPRMHPAPWPYADQVAHARAVDAWLGLDPAGTEARVVLHWKPNLDLSLTGTQAWVGLPSDSLQTPYTELRQMLEAVGLAEGATVCDLGAGYGRMGFVIQALFPGLRFLGLELVGERVREGSRVLALHDCDRARLLEGDITAAEFRLPDAAVFFVYDFGSREAIARLLNLLRARARIQPVTVIGRGRATRDAIERGEPWLSQMFPPVHFERFSIYRSG